ncbi:AAA family ATPase [Erwinia mallotivora]|nr:AAA family ATPase [Erwinia mallotivora]
MSGTMHDKFPPEIYKKNIENQNIVYLGNKVNNNMISDIAPFRTLCKFVLRKVSDYNEPITTNKYLIDYALSRLNFEDKFIFKFRYGKNRKEEVFSSVPSELTISLTNPQDNTNLLKKYVNHVELGDILLSDISFHRKGRAFGLSELSSGEKQYALALFGFFYCGCSNSIIFYDEPENSLHPLWQLTIINDLSLIIDKLYPDATFLVATHSPLIASSVRNNKTFICDFPSGQSWKQSDLFGQASDTVLREQFHLYSARSPEIYEIINKCLDLISNNKKHSSEFKNLQFNLKSFNLQLTSDDPLYKVVKTILSFNL